MKEEYILGISCFFHDSAACLINTKGEIIGAIQEERLSRKKHDFTFPSLAISKIIEEKNISVSQIKNIIFYEKPFLKFERVLDSLTNNFPYSFPTFVKFMPSWSKEKLLTKGLIKKKLVQINNDFKSANIAFSNHHLSHAASSFFPSPFESSAILTIDGVGEKSTTTISFGEQQKIEILQEILYPNSLGLLYSAITELLGFKVNSGEYKVMGLAPYGEANLVNLFKENLVYLYEDGSFELNMEFFDFDLGFKTASPKMLKLFDLNGSSEKLKLTYHHANIAASLQQVLEEAVVNLAKHAKHITKSKNLCLAGGVALNCVANSKIRDSKIFDNVWVQPASGDAGGSLGATLAYLNLNYATKDDKRIFTSMKNSYLGSSYTKDQIEKILKTSNAVYHEYEENELIKKTSRLLADGNVVGWFNGKMEFGPRALGNRSILADPRNIEMQKSLNLKIKYRESFRPFAPVVKAEKARDWFDINTESPYMLFTSKVSEKHIYKKTSTKKAKSSQPLSTNDLLHQRSKIAAVTHLDYSARVQTINKIENTRLWKLIDAFEKITNVPILVNTSFNVRGEPIVESPEDAYQCFMGTNMDVLVIENFLLLKPSQPEENIIQNFASKYEAD